MSTTTNSSTSATAAVAEVAGANNNEHQQQHLQHLRHHHYHGDLHQQPSQPHHHQPATTSQAWQFRRQLYSYDGDRSNRLSHAMAACASVASIESSSLAGGRHLAPSSITLGSDFYIARSPSPVPLSAMATTINQYRTCTPTPPSSMNRQSLLGKFWLRLARL